jgi:hypothetical protein
MSTYTPIASLTLSANTSSVTFSGIPQNYTDLILVISLKPYSSSEGSIRLNFNSDTGSNYSWTYLTGEGTSAVSGNGSNTANIPFSYGNALNNPRQPLIFMNIMNYSNNTTYKRTLHRTSSADSSGYVDAWAGLWRNTNPITSFTISVSYIFDIGAGSTFSLYGIDAQASAQAKATGGSSITTDGTYWYHTFYSSGTFTPTQNLSNVDYLVVAGGGAGGHWQNTGGGGGAGGLRCTLGATGGGGSVESKLSLSSTSYTIVVGAGGATKGTYQTPGSQGSNSSISGTGISTISSTGGGGGGSGYGNNNGAATTGGSGGGGWAIDGNMYSNVGAAGTNNQGFSGGDGIISGSFGFAGGGGGAGEAGNTDGQGQGGDGVATSISGSSVTYAGGGGGGKDDRAGGTPGDGGDGGGGRGGGGSGNRSATSGTANSGGGGGGGGASGTTVGLGGSGIVIIRYSAV